jgi:hypothetical protein
MWNLSPAAAAAFTGTSEGAKTRYSKKSEKNFLKIRCLLQNPEHFSLQVLEKS